MPPRSFDDAICNAIDRVPIPPPDHIKTLGFVFQLIQNSEDWMLSIDTTIPKTMTAIVRESIMYYVGVEPTFTEVSAKAVRVTSIGRRAQMCEQFVASILP